MNVGIHLDEYGKFPERLQRYETILDFNNIHHIRMDANDPDFWEKVKTLDLFIFRWPHFDWYRQLAQTILPIIENDLKIKCFPDQATCWHYDDKIRQYYLLRQHKYPMVESWIFWEREKAIDWAKRAAYPVVFKLKGGAGSQNVLLVRNENKAVGLINQMFGKGIRSNKIKDPDATRWHDRKLYKMVRHWGGDVLRRLENRYVDLVPDWQRQKNYVLFQRFLPNNKYDTRVTVLGERAFAYRRFVRKNDFRASGSGNFDTDPSKIDIRCVEIALKVSREMKFQSMTYDFIFDDNNIPGFCEISYTFVDWMVQSCPGYWDSSLIWHEGHYWPQFCHLADALQKPELKQPMMER